MERSRGFYAVVKANGKTISAVRILKKRLSLYPKTIFFTNTEIKGIKNKTFYFSNCDELTKLLKTEINSTSRDGYVIFIDEIHVVLAELFGKTDPIFLMFLSQQRKLNINIIGTSQMYNKCPRVIRDYLRQSGQIIICTNLFKLLQINKIINMDSVEEDSKNNLIFKGCKFDWFFHNLDLYNSYNTFAVISQIQGLLDKDLRRLQDNDRYVISSDSAC